jgi:cation:H+ antiporter
MDSISVERGGHRLCGTKLSRYGDQIVDLTGLGGLWTGVVLMAGATSLPELFIDVSAALMDTPDLAAGLCSIPSQMPMP